MTDVNLSLPVLRRAEHPDPAVERLQVMLNFVGGLEAGGVAVDEDGVFGPKTETAVKNFQETEDLAPDGMVGSQTWAALLTRWVLYAAAC